MSTDTPRTDDLVENGWDKCLTGLVPADFARTLEREPAEAVDARITLAKQNLALIADCERLERELNAAKAAATYLNVRRIEKERDAFSDELTSKGNLIAALRAENAELRKDKELLTGELAGGVGRIAKERFRQISQEGWDASHDDTHTDGSLRVVAAMLSVKDTDATVEDPLDRDDWNLGRHPLERRLEIAGALIAAELDRVERRDAARTQEGSK